MVKIDYSKGTETHIKYEATPIKGMPGPNYYVSYHSTKLPAVKTITIINTALNQEYVTEYEYEGGLWDSVEKEFRGYAKVRQIDDEGHYTESLFHQDHLRKGRSYEEARYSSLGELFAKTENTWSVQNDVHPGVSFVYLSQVDQYTFDKDGSNGRRTQEQFVYGETPQLGNLTEQIELGEVDLLTGNDIGQDKRSTGITYGNNTLNDPYLAGFPQHIVTKDFYNIIMSQTWLTYDDAADYTILPIKGLLTEQKEWAGSLSIEHPVTRFSYDVFGNLVSIMDPLNNSTSITYDNDWALYPVTITNALNQEEKIAYYGIEGILLDSGDGYQGLFGQIRSTTDLNDQQTQYAYDQLGRLVKTVGPLDTINFPTTEIIYNLTATHKQIITKQRVSHGQAEALNTYQFYDGLDRLFQTKTPLESSGNYAVSGQKKYNFRGVPDEVYLPFTSNDSNAIETIDTSRPHTTFIYDALGRTIQTTNPDGTFRSMEYEDWVVTTIDENGHQQKLHLDAFNRPEAKEEYFGADGRGGTIYPDTGNYTLYADTDYFYDSEDNLKAILDAHNNVTYINYDGLSRKTSLSDPAMSEEAPWRYSYDMAGNITSQMDPKEEQINLSYDFLNRVVNKKDIFTQGTEYNVSYQYDFYWVPFSKGRLFRITYDTQSQGEISFFYDELGRVIRKSRDINDTRFYSIENSYDALSRVTTLTYPNGNLLSYTYNPAGQAETITHSSLGLLVQDVNYNTAGLISEITYGNGVVTQYEYYADTLWLKRIYSVNSSQEVVQDLNYTYEASGQILTITNAVNSLNNQTFDYDALNRLVTALGSYGLKTYVYDAIGNVIEKDGLTYSYPPADQQVHSVSSLSDGTSFMYDRNSNMQTRNQGGVTTEYVYDKDNQLIEVKEGGVTVARYDYDSEGARVRKVHYQAGDPVPQVVSDTTYYVDGIYEESDSGRTVEHVFLGEQRVASIVNGQVQYYHGDHLGGAHVLTDNAGAKVEVTTYEPYGKINTHETYGVSGQLAQYYFTDQEFDGEAGLYYYGARHYDPVLGRFLQADAIVPDPLNSQSLNRHSYTLNNPVNFIDPTGNSEESSQENDNDNDNDSDNSSGEGDATGGSQAPQLVNFGDSTVSVSSGNGDSVMGQMIDGPSGSMVGMFKSDYDKLSGSDIGISSDSLHGFLDVAGVFFDGADAINAGLYAAQGDLGNAALSAGSLVPLVGILSTAGKWGKKADNIPIIKKLYKRPSGATTKAQRKSVQGQLCVDCGTKAPKQFADHKSPLVKEYYETGTIDTNRMRSLGSVQPQCPTCSARQGGKLRGYSLQKRKEYGF